MFLFLWLLFLRLFLSVKLIVIFYGLDLSSFVSFHLLFVRIVNWLFMKLVVLIFLSIIFVNFDFHRFWCIFLFCIGLCGSVGVVLHLLVLSFFLLFDFVILVFEVVVIDFLLRHMIVAHLFLFINFGGRL